MSSWVGKTLAFIFPHTCMSFNTTRSRCSPLLPSLICKQHKPVPIVLHQPPVPASPFQTPISRLLASHLCTGPSPTL